jgi:hypothetical protein
MQLLAECVKGEARAIKCERARVCCLAPGVLPRRSFGGLAEKRRSYDVCVYTEALVRCLALLSPPATTD